MENNNKEKEKPKGPSPLLNGQNMDRENPVDSYIDDQKSQAGRNEEFKEEEEKGKERHAEWPFSELHQQVIDLPDGDTDEKKSSDDEPK